MASDGAHKPIAQGGVAQGGAAQGGVAHGMTRSNRPVVVYTDGACKGNPGPGGWGAILIRDGSEEELFGGEAQTTNNRMELVAVIQALAALPPATEVELHTDSQYVKNGMESWIHSWKRNGWRTSDRKPVRNAELWRELDTQAARHRVRWHWVKGHAGTPGNDRADALANRGADAHR